VQVILNNSISMAKIEKIVIVAVIGVFVIFSGCTENTTNVQSPNVQSTEVQSPNVQSTAFKTEAPYTFSVTEIKTIEECINSGPIKPCTLINLEVKNNNLRSLDFKIVTEEVISKSGKLLEARFDREVGLSNLCARQAGMEFKLNANTNQNVALCYPIVYISDTPSLNIGALINGERKEYKFDLIKYGLTD